MIQAAINHIVEGGVQLSPRVCLLNDFRDGGNGKCRIQEEYLIAHFVNSS